MKNAMLKVCLLGAVITASVQVSHGVSVSSQPVNVASGAVGAPFLIQANESISYLITSTCPTDSVNRATVTIQYSDSLSNWKTEVTTAPTASALWSVSGSLPIKSRKTYYRFKINEYSGATGGIVITLKDNDDAVAVWKNNKGVDIVTLKDESLNVAGAMKALHETYVTDTSSAIVMISSNTQIQWKNAPPVDRVWNGGGSVIVKSRFVQFVTTAGLAGSVDAAYVPTLTAKPIISTVTATNGDIITFMCLSSSATFSDNATVSGTGMKLATGKRTLGFGDILQVIFYNNIWYEMFYVNNEQ
jgi:hypothetical protein